MSVITYFRRATPADLTVIGQSGDDPRRALEHAGALPGTHTDRAWAGLRFLLLDLEPPVDVLHGGEPLTGPLRLLRPGDVRAAAGFLSATPFAGLAAGYDRALLESTGVYPEYLWEADWALSYLEDAYLRLVPFFTEAAGTRSHVLTWRA